MIGSYYPALTAACALGERILNHLVLALRDNFKSTSQYKSVYNKQSFDDWDLAIDTLEAWGVLLPAAVEAFRSLKSERHRAIHFRPETDQDDRSLALSALQSLAKVIQEQFSGFGTQPWFIPGARGESFIAKAAERQPFVSKIYLPNCALVGPRHRIEFRGNQILVHDEEYPARDVTDEEFLEMRATFLRA
jgi:hypothetical protein